MAHRHLAVLFSALVTVAAACGGSSSEPSASAPDDPRAALTQFHQALEQSLALRSARRIAAKQAERGADEVAEDMKYCVEPAWDDGEHEALAKQAASIALIRDPALAESVDYAGKSWELAQRVVEQGAALCRAVTNDGAIEALLLVLATNASDYDDVAFELGFAVKQLDADE